MAESPSISIEVAWATPAKQCVRQFDIKAGTPIRAVVCEPDIAAMLADVQIDARAAALGIFGRRVGDDYLPKAGDRVEIYRPLHRDPREARRLRARSDPN